MAKQAQPFRCNFSKPVRSLSNQFTVGLGFRVHDFFLKMQIRVSYFSYIALCANCKNAIFFLKIQAILYFSVDRFAFLYLFFSRQRCQPSHDQNLALTCHLVCNLNRKKQKKKQGHNGQKCETFKFIPIFIGRQLKEHHVTCLQHKTLSDDRH